ncbi:MAG: cytochrome c maturation protein CcmE [Pseudomonadota bacterium]
MTPRQQRMLSVGLLLGGLALVSALSIGAFKENTGFYFELDQVAAGETPPDRAFRVGGLVKEGSLYREPGSLELEFTLTDTKNELVVAYTGVLPDLFRDGQGIIARGQLGEDGRFVAEEVLAKHDENYMPPEVADSLERQGYKPAEEG